MCARTKDSVWGNQSVQECRSASLTFGWYHLRLMVEEEEEEEEEKVGEEDDEENYSFLR